MKKILYAYTVITNTSKDYEKTIYETYQSLLNSKLSFSYSIFINGVKSVNSELTNFINKYNLLDLISISTKQTLPEICLKVIDASEDHLYLVRIDEGDSIKKNFFKEFAKKLIYSKKDLFIPSYLIVEKNKNPFSLNAKNVCWQKKSKLLSEFHGAGTIILRNHAKKGYIFGVNQDRQDGYTLWLNSINASFEFIEKSIYIYNKEENSLSDKNHKVLEARLNCLKNLFKSKRKNKLVIVTAFKNKDSFESYILENNLCKIIDKLFYELKSLGFDVDLVVFGRGGLSGRFKNNYQEFSKDNNSIVEEIMHLMQANHYEYCCYVNPKYIFTTIEESLTCLLQTIYISCNCGIIIEENEGLISNIFGELIGLSRETKIESIQRARQSGIIALKYKEPSKLIDRNYLLDPESCTLCLGSELGSIRFPNLSTYNLIKNALS
tara:strand:+ start:876 stop:2183 length:1308 start_codon:yes stop_codon:yes gene_type:complete